LATTKKEGGEGHAGEGSEAAGLVSELHAV
jgi:hypothetical protein